MMNTIKICIFSSVITLICVLNSHKIYAENITIKNQFCEVVNNNNNMNSQDILKKDKKNKDKKNKDKKNKDKKNKDKKNKDKKNKDKKSENEKLKNLQEELLVKETELKKITEKDSDEYKKAWGQILDIQKKIKKLEKKSKATFHTVLKNKFLEGGPAFMGIVLLVLILGLALCIERIIYLNLASTNTDRLLNHVENALKKSGVKGAKNVCRNTAGPVASIFLQGIERSKEGINVVEKSIINAGNVAMSKLESGLSWISLFIALAPMLGFMGTVIGMIKAFDAIEIAGDISPSLVAGGIKVALLTTVFGLITAIILQIFYNYITAKIENIVNNMEDASIGIVDLLLKHKITKK